MAVSKNSVTTEAVTSQDSATQDTMENAATNSNEQIMLMLAQMQQELLNLKSENERLRQETETQPVISPRLSEDEDITIVMNYNGRVDIPLPDLSLVMTRFGEERQVTKKQFQSLVGKYRKFFDKEFLLLGPKHLDLADKYKVSAYNPNSSKFIHPNDLNTVGELEYNELETYYKNLSEPSKVGFLSYWYSKCYEKDPKFYNIAKMELLNRASRSKTFNIMIRELTSIEEKYSNNSSK